MTDIVDRLTASYNELRKEAAVTITRLRAKLEAAEKETASWKELAKQFGNEADALRAKIAEMEWQEPVGKAELMPGASGFTMACFRAGAVPLGSKLYALPGAQPAPSEQDESVRKSWARFSNELHRGPDAPYPGMSEAFEQHFSQSFTDREWRLESGVWAAAWKAAKRHGAQPAPSVPDGCKLVPIEPTQEMINHVIDERFEALVAGKDHTFINIYKAMLAAAPEAKP